MGLRNPDSKTPIGGPFASEVHYGSVPKIFVTVIRSLWSSPVSLGKGLCYTLQYNMVLSNSKVIPIPVMWTHHVRISHVNNSEGDFLFHSRVNEHFWIQTLRPIEVRHTTPQYFIVQRVKLDPSKILYSYFPCNICTTSDSIGSWIITTLNKHLSNPTPPYYSIKQRKERERRENYI